MVHAREVRYRMRQDLQQVEPVARAAPPRHERRHDDGRGLQLEGYRSRRPGAFPRSCAIFMNSPPSDEAVGGFVFDFEHVSGEVATRHVTHRYPVQLFNLEVVRRDRVVGVLFVGEIAAVGLAFLAYTLGQLVIGHVPWYLVEQAPHGLPRFTRDFRMV